MSDFCRTELGGRPLSKGEAELMQLAHDHFGWDIFPAGVWTGDKPAGDLYRLSRPGRTSHPLRADQVIGKLQDLYAEDEYERELKGAPRRAEAVRELLDRSTADRHPDGQWQGDREAG